MDKGDGKVGQFVVLHTVVGRYIRFVCVMAKFIEEEMTQTKQKLRQQQEEKKTTKESQ